MSVTCAVRLARALGLSTTLLCALLASGCTTLKAVQEVGKQAAEGNVLTAAYTATIGVAVAAIVDVVTLGGAVSPEEGMGLITAAAAASEAGTVRPSVPATTPAAGTATNAPQSAGSTAGRQSARTPLPSAASQSQNISINGQIVSGPNAGQPSGAGQMAAADRPCPDRGTSREQYIAHVQCQCPRSGGRMEIRGDSVSCVVNGSWIYGCTFRDHRQQGQANCSQR